MATDEDLVVDLNTNTITRDGLTATVRPREAEVVAILARFAPAPVHRERIAVAIWGADAEEWPDTWVKAIDVHLVYLRRHLRPLGYAIEAVRKGWHAESLFRLKRITS